MFLNLKNFISKQNIGKPLINIKKSLYKYFFHYEGCEPAVYFSALGNEDPGVITIASRLFTLPEDALKSTFKLNSEQIDSINKTLPVSLNNIINTITVIYTF